MFDNCKNCLIYDVEDDDMLQQLFDEDVIGQPNVPPHYCLYFYNGIPKEVWDGKEKCKHFFDK